MRSEPNRHGALLSLPGVCCGQPMDCAINRSCLRRGFLFPSSGQSSRRLDETVLRAPGPAWLRRLTPAANPPAPEVRAPRSPPHTAGVLLPQASRQSNMAISADPLLVGGLVDTIVRSNQECAPHGHPTRRPARTLLDLQCVDCLATCRGCVPLQKRRLLFPTLNSLAQPNSAALGHPQLTDGVIVEWVARQLVVGSKDPLLRGETSAF